jgi:hypothetical protein
MATPNRFAIRDCGEATFYSLTTLKPIVTLKSLKTSGVETKGNTVYARGGRGNAKIVGFSSDREANIKLQDAIFDVNAIAMLTGNSLTKGATVIDNYDTLTATSNTITLSKTPTGAIIGVYKLNADGTLGAEYTLGTLVSGQKYFQITGKSMTFFAGSEPDGTQFRVYYKMTTDTTASTMKVTTDAFGGSFRIVLDVLVRDEYTKADYAAQLNIPCGKFEDNFNLNFEATGDPAVLDLPIEILKNPANTDMWSLTIYDESLVV